MPFMKKTWKIFRAAIIGLLAMLIAIPIGLYMIFSTPWAQQRIRDVAVSELSALMATNVKIGRIEIHPFNRLSIYDISANDDKGDPAMDIGEISIAFEFFHLMRTGKLVVDFALIDRPNIRLSRNDIGSPINIAGIISRLKSDDPQRPQSHYDLIANTVIISNGTLSYDVIDIERAETGFDPRHIRIDDIFLNAYIPRISNDGYRVEIDRLSFKEQCGFSLNDLTTAISVDPSHAQIEYLNVELPHSTIAFAPVSLNTNGINALPDSFRDLGISVGIRPGSSVYIPDISSFCPAMSEFSQWFDIELDAHISSHEISVDRLFISESSGSMRIVADGMITQLDKGFDAGYELGTMKVYASGDEIRAIAGYAQGNSIAKNISSRIRSSDTFSADICAGGSLCNATFDSSIAFADNSIAISGSYDSQDSLKTINLKLDGKIDFPDLSLMLPDPAPSAITSDISLKAGLTKGSSSIEIDMDSVSMTYRGYTYRDIAFNGSMINHDLEAVLRMDDPNIKLELGVSGRSECKTKHVQGHISVHEADLNALGLIGSHPGYKLRGHAESSICFSNADDITGSLVVEDVSFDNGLKDDPSLILKYLSIEADPSGMTPSIDIKSDFLNGHLDGKYRFSTMMPSLAEMAGTVFPSLFDKHATNRHDKRDDCGNDFHFDLTLSEAEETCKFLDLPLSVIYPIEINADLHDQSRYASISIDAPYLLQGGKIIENTSIDALVDASDNSAKVYATATMPTQKGPMAIVASLSGASDRIDNRIEWVIERNIPINGAFDFSTSMMRDDSDNLVTQIEFNPGTITFGEDAWSINPSVIRWSEGQIDVEHFAMTTGSEAIAINGTAASDDEDKSLYVELHNIALLDIFETLEIDKALIGGTASGTFIGHNLLSGQPSIECDRLHVDDISYNRCVLGDAEIAAHWDNDKKSFYLDADITDPEARHSRISGDIFPSGEALDISFDADHVVIGFMKPFMDAFASDLSGHASGHARLFGTFKYIDMEGDLFADDLKIKIDFTNTWYSASDSIKLRPGIIDIRNVTVHDINGHTANLNGVVRHKFFKEPSFDFKVSNAHDFLSYNVDSKISPDWYGTVYGNGGATISGEPGIVNIGVNMSTAPKSVFTFVLSDRLDADEYSFITFKDSKAEAVRDSLLATDNVPTAVKAIRSRLGNQEGDNPSAYNMDLQIDINPDARIILVMDPVGGDEIKSTGSGNLRLTYESLNNDLKMYGTYTLDHGSYNFTLQDIIIKDFSIKDGSSIAFHGDPYSAQLDIEATYAVNANLSDLDESFLQDKDLNRTNVPVHALLKVKGDMRQPDIDFDLEFPTLTQDTYRKVRSIVSTEEMMNRQIIYLLALNRFYTPDYMASTTKGNELFSVASSTISSQLSSMLGKLSENWSIAPNLRSDRGDFSDVEVDVALSSRLLNNRLLFNGNFGYRDKALNTNQFVGDFDIEYLLNRKGSWRLKAYNRYNDQNYYVRTAQTTQGIGIMFKKDFDDFFSFLRPKKRTEDNSDTQPNSQAAVTPDSIAIDDASDTGINPDRNAASDQE